MTKAAGRLPQQAHDSLRIMDVGALTGVFHSKLYDHVPLNSTATYKTIFDAANIDEAAHEHFPARL